MIGWQVKWSSSFRTFQGIVVSEIRNSDLEGDYTCQVYSEDDDEIYPLPHHNDKSTCIRAVKPNVEGYLKYCYHKSAADEPFTLTQFANCLSNIPMKDKAMKDAKANVLNNIDAIYHKIRNSISDTLNESVDSKKSTENNINSVPSQVVVSNIIENMISSINADNSKSNDSNNDDDNIDSDSSDDNDSESESSVVEEENGDDEEDDGNDRSESSGDDEGSNNNSDDDSSNSTSSSSGDETNESFSQSFDSADFGQQSISTLGTSASQERRKRNRRHHRNRIHHASTTVIEPVVNVKVYLQDTQEMRGFSVPKASQGHEYIMNILKQDYQLTTLPLLTYRDYDGDTITIRGQNDFMYAVQSQKYNHDVSSSSATLTSNFDDKQRNNNNSTATIKLYASFGSDYNNNKSTNNNTHTERFPTVANTTASKTTTTTQPKSSPSSARVHPLNIATQNSNGYNSSNNKTEATTTHNRNSVSKVTAITFTPTAKITTTPSATTVVTNYISNRPKLCHLLWQRGEIIGTGSFGQVYSGLDLKTGNKLAVKEVYLGMGGGVSNNTHHNNHNNNIHNNNNNPMNKKQKQQAKALRQEIKILSKLDHPNIIKYYGTEVIECSIMRIFLELATEGSVKDVLTHFGPLSESIVRRYANDILQGLNYLHSKGVIHRDIKPTNLLVSNGVVKVADFGCSSMNFDTFLTTDNGHDTIAGTTVYMSPEVMKAEKSSGSAFSSPVKQCNRENRKSSILVGNRENRKSSIVVANNVIGQKLQKQQQQQQLDDDLSLSLVSLQPHIKDVPAAQLLSAKISPRQKLQPLQCQQRQPSSTKLTTPRDPIQLLSPVPNDSIPQQSQKQTPRKLAPIAVASASSKTITSSSSTATITTTNTTKVKDNQNVDKINGNDDDDEDEVISNNNTDNGGNNTTNSTGGYGRKADIWSLGITLVELSTGKSPYRSAASAIYAVCVTKEFPTFPRHFSQQAVDFLSRCLVENPKLRADCVELLQHPFVASVPAGSLKSSKQNKNNGYHMLENINNDDNGNFDEGVNRNSNEYCLLSSSLESDAQPTSSSLKHTLSPIANNGNSNINSSNSSIIDRDSLDKVDETEGIANARRNNRKKNNNSKATTTASHHKTNVDDYSSYSIPLTGDCSDCTRRQQQQSYPQYPYGTRSTLEFEPATPLTTGRQPQQSTVTDSGSSGRRQLNYGDCGDDKNNGSDCTRNYRYNNTNHGVNDSDDDEDNNSCVDETVMTASLLSPSSSVFPIKQQRTQLERLNLRQQQQQQPSIPLLHYRQQRPASTPYPLHSLSPRALQLQSLSRTHHRASVDIGALDRISLQKNNDLKCSANAYAVTGTTTAHHHRHNSMFVSITSASTRPTTSTVYNTTSSLSLSTNFICNSRATTAATMLPALQQQLQTNSFNDTGGSNNSVNNRRYAMSSNNNKHHDQFDDSDNDDENDGNYGDNYGYAGGDNIKTNSTAAAAVMIISEPSVGESFDFDQYFS